MIRMDGTGASSCQPSAKAVRAAMGDAQAVLETAQAADDDPFAFEVCLAFGDLIHRPERVIESMRPCGPAPKPGDAIVALPTLVHRGPGGNDQVRAMCMCTLCDACDVRNCELSC